MAVAGINEAHRRDRLPLIAPGPTFDRQARRAARNAERFRRRDVRSDGPDRMLRRAPGNFRDQPWPRGDLGKTLLGGLRNGSEIDQPLLQAKNRLAREMP